MAQNEKKEINQRIDYQRRVVGEIEGLGPRILEKFKEEKLSGRKPLSGRQIPSQDEAQIQALTERFREAALITLDAESALEVWGEIEELVESRRRGNRELSGMTSEVAGQRAFEKAVRENFPEVEMSLVRGEKVLSTFKGGLGEMAKKKVSQIIFSLGKKKGGESVKNIFDDGFVLRSRGMQLYNAVNGGDSSEGEFIPWSGMDDLSFSVEAMPILAPINTFRRNFLAKPDPISPVGLIKVFERAGQASDKEIPDKVRVLVENPEMWVDGLNEVKRIMSGRMSGKSGGFQASIFYADFANLGLLDIVESPIFTKGILRKRADERVIESLNEWARMSEVRKRR